MTDLKDQVIESSKQLESAWKFLKGISSPSLPQKCYEHWIRRADLHQSLSGTSAIFEARTLAWELVNSILNQTNIKERPEDNNVMYGQIKMDYAVARHLALTSYMSVTWSIYDRLANVCGRLSGTAFIAEHKKRNPKVSEDFLAKEDPLWFEGQVLLKEAYAWPLKVSYKVRNWLVHEGYETGSVPLFKSENLKEGFTLHFDAIQKLNEDCKATGSDGKAFASCVAEKNDKWKQGDLLMILDQYNGEIDIMFSAFLKWSVDSYVGQIKAFAARDQV